MTTKVDKSITVNVPVSTAYNQWTQFEEFPKFMGGVQRVEQIDDATLRWVAEIAGVRREWQASILEQRPDQKVAWAADAGATNAGAVHFSAAGPGQTVVRLELEFEPEGFVEKVGDALNFVDRQATADLQRFKEFIESRHTETGAWRGSVRGGPVGTPGVEDATSQGDSGKAGVSAKAAAAGVAAAAAGVAAAAAVSRSSGADKESESVTGAGTTPQDLVGAAGTDPLTGEGAGAVSAGTELGGAAGAGSTRGLTGTGLDDTTGVAGAGLGETVTGDSPLTDLTVGGETAGGTTAGSEGVTEPMEGTTPGVSTANDGRQDDGIV